MTTNLNLRETFWTPYDQMKEHIGKKFKVIREIPSWEIDEELAGEQFEIELECGTRITAWLEEIYEGSCEINGKTY